MKTAPDENEELIDAQRYPSAADLPEDEEPLDDESGEYVPEDENEEDDIPVEEEAEVDELTGPENDLVSQPEQEDE